MSIKIGYSEEHDAWCFIVYGPKHEARTVDGRLGWQWRLEWRGWPRVLWQPYRADAV